MPDGKEPDDVTTGDSIGDAIRHELDAISRAEPVADPVGGWQSGGGATGSVPFGGSKFTYHDPSQDSLSTRYPKAQFTEFPERKEARDIVDPGARVEKWADVAMWAAPPHTDPQRPKVTVSMCTPDPLGVMAMVNAQYTGRNLTSPGQVTDAERREAWEAATVSKLSETPLEWIQWSINFENVSRGFTHQLVRTRLATYAQESQRFGVKDNIGDAVKLPPSLAGTLPWHEFEREMVAEGVDPGINASKEQMWRRQWDDVLDAIAITYGSLVDSGMPAEDARGLLPTNMLTRVHMRVDMKTLLNLAGMRLCTQAQFEWRAVFAELAKAIRTYGARYDTARWQYELIADSFRPVCYAVGHCPMQAKSDRHCSIRDRVEFLAGERIPSTQWENPEATGPANVIQPVMWLADPTAARVAPGQEK
jgi:flavin-dependent thymidylate synthase